MDNISLKNFRCFWNEQTVRLAPLTLLVGENSTGKSSFMAGIRSLWDATHNPEVLDFKEEPYDLGSHDEIVHYRGGRGRRATTFELGFSASEESYREDKRSKASQRSAGSAPHIVSFEFKERGRAPIMARRRHSRADTWLEYNTMNDKEHHIGFGTRNGSWKLQGEGDDRGYFQLHGDSIPPFHYVLFLLRQFLEGETVGLECINQSGPTNPSKEDSRRLIALAEWHFFAHRVTAGRPFASAPVRSKPRRTYDPARPVYDPEGDYIPMLLANMQFQSAKGWAQLKGALEEFGRMAGLFDELSIKSLGKKGSDPFQVHIRKFGKSAKGPRRNLMDVGYGVSQVLPVLTELLRANGPNMFLLQQPEVHLHPSAQAALGTLFCRIANPKRKLVVETHSDHLLDRIRMDVRDGTTPLGPDDVSVLFFERNDLHVDIHSLRLDSQGNVLNVPPSYRQFFLEESNRDLGL